MAGRYGVLDSIADLFVPIHRDGHKFLGIGLALTILFGAAALFALAPIVQTRLVAAAPDRRTVVLALNGSMIFLGQGIGAAVGGVTIDVASLAFVGLAGASLAVLGVVLAASTRAVAPVRVSP